MENKKSKVSIGMPVWNGEDFIKLALDSLLAQDFKDFEIIISDNASTDNTEEICEKYIKKDERIKYIRQCENIGLDRNFNFVLDKAKGEYFMWAAHDDLWEPTYISEMVKVLDNNKSVVLAFCIKDDHFIERGCYYPPGIFLKGTIFKKALTFLTKSLHPIYVYGLIRTPVIKKIGWPISFKKLNRGTYASDALIPFRLIFKGDFYVVDKVLFHHRYMRKYTDIYMKSQKKLDIMRFFILNVLKLFLNIHEYFAKIRKIIFESDLKSHQKYFLVCVTLVLEFKLFIETLYHYFISFLKFVYNKNYRKEYCESAVRYNPEFREKRGKKKKYQ